MTSSQSSAGIEGYLRPVVASFGAYIPSKSPKTIAKELGVSPESIINLGLNENLYGCSPRVQQALAACHYFHTYPDAGQVELRQQLQEYTGIDASRIVADNGSDGLITNILRLFIDSGDKVINFVPTFDIFRHRVQILGGEMVNIPRDENFAINVKAAKEAIDSKTKMIILVNPNNPTGTVTPREDVLELADIGLPFLVDEAYYEFSGETVTPLINRYSNLMITRTLSKWTGLAGLRIGYGIFPVKIAEYLLKIKEPFSVGIAAGIAARESLADVDYLMSTVRALIAERERLFNELANLKFLKPFPSKTNFILCSVLKDKAAEIQEKLEQRGIIIRYYDKPPLENFIRITVGKPEHTDALLKALGEIKGKIDG